MNVNFRNRIFDDNLTNQVKINWTDVKTTEDTPLKERLEGSQRQTRTDLEICFHLTVKKRLQRSLTSCEMAKFWM